MAEFIQGTFAIASLPLALLFLILYSRRTEHWWNPWSWFGFSLWLMAFAILLYSTAVALARTLGLDYWGRDILIVAAQALTFLSLLIRVLVLIGAQRRDRQK